MALLRLKSIRKIQDLMTYIRTFWHQHKKILKTLIGICILALIALQLDWQHLEQLTLSIDICYFIVALFLMTGQVFALGLRWKILMNAEEDLVTYKESLNINVASQIANFLFITSVGGILLKLLLARHYGMSILKSLCAVVADKMMSIFAIFAFAIIFLPVLATLLPEKLLNHTMLILAIAVPSLLIAPIAVIKILFPFIRNNKSLYPPASYLKQLLEKPKLSVPIILSSLIAQGAFFIAGCLAAKAIGLDFDILKFMAILPFIALASSLPIGFGGWGIREGAFVIGLSFLKIPMESAFLISVQVGILSILATFVLALPLMVFGGLLDVFRASRDQKASDA